jgi:hypothetical protein
VTNLDLNGTGSISTASHLFLQFSPEGGECCHSLSLPFDPLSIELSFEEKIVRIQRYLFKGLTEKILTQRENIEGERKQVTVMFCDMEGFAR